MILSRNVGVTRTKFANPSVADFPASMLLTKLLPFLKTTERVSTLHRTPNAYFLGLTICVAQYSATQINGKINDVQKQIGMKKKVFGLVKSAAVLGC